MSATGHAVPTRRLSMTLRAIGGRSYPRLIGMNRDRWWVFYDLLLPLLGTLSFVFAYRAIGAPDRYTGYVILGSVTTALWINVMWSMAVQLYVDKRTGNLELYMTSPCGLVPILLGMSIGGLVATSLRAAAVVAIGSLLFDVTYQLAHVPLFVALFALASVALYGLGIAFSSLFLVWGREAEHVANLMTEPVYFASGFYFPVRTLGFGVGLVASVMPLTLALDAMRQIVFPGTRALLPVGVEVALLGVLAVAFAFAAGASLRAMERMARREGRLGIRY